MNRDILVLREVVQKLVPLLAGKGLVVTQRGSQAFVQTNIVTKKPEVVNIPNIPDTATSDFIAAVQGFIDHEIAHVLITDWTIYGGSPSTQAEMKDPKVKRFMNLHNITEDTMIEREIVKIFPGSAKNIAVMRRHFIEKITKVALAGAKSDQERFNYLLVPAMRALADHAEFQEFMDEGKHWDNPIVKAVVDGLSKAALKSLKTCSTTKETYDVAREVENILYPPPPPAPPAPSSPEKSEEGESENKPEKKAGEGDGDGERDHSEDLEENEEEEGKPDADDDGSGSEAEPEAEDDSDADDADDDDAEDLEDDGDDLGDLDDEIGDSEDAASPEGDEEDDDGKDDGDDDLSEGDDDDDGADPDDESEYDGEGIESDSEDEGDADEAEGGASGGVGSDGEDDEGEESEASGGSASDDSLGEDEGDSGGMEGDEDADPEFGGGVGTEAAKSAFDFEDDAFDRADMSSQIADLISDEMVRSIDRSEYLVYTRDFDRIEPLVPPAEIHKKWIPDMEDTVAQMTGRMQKDIERAMASQSFVIRTPGHRSGKLHGPSLYRVGQNDPRVFSQRQEHVSKDTAVTLLIDNSGSMRGRKLTTAMYAAYAMSTTLNRVKIAHEMIGFTSGEYSGDDFPQSVLDAMDQEMRSTGIDYDRTTPIIMPIYKSFDERIDAMVKKRIAYMANAQNGCNGNIDGESLEYAAVRLMRRPEKRKVMLVLSDGQPAVGPKGGPHLKMVVQDLTKAGIEVMGIGIEDRSVSRYYENFVVLNNVADLPNEVMSEIKRILA